MKNHRTRNILLVVGTIITALLAVGVIVVSTLLQQKGSAPVAPNVPESQPSAAGTASCTTSFTPTGPIVVSPSCVDKSAYTDLLINHAGSYFLQPTGTNANAIAANSSLALGQQFVYVLNGKLLPSTSHVASVIWKDTLDARLTYVDGSAGCTPAANTDGTTTVTCTSSNTSARGISPGLNGQYWVAIRVKLKTTAIGGTLNNSATVADAAAPTVASTACAFPLNITIPGVAACLSKTPYKDIATNTAGNYDASAANQIPTNSAVTRGQELVYILRSSPLTSTATADVVWKDTLDPRLTFVDASAGCTHATVNGAVVVTCNKGKVGKGASYSVGIRVKVTATATAGTLVNTAIVTTGGANPSSCPATLSIGTVSCNSTCTTAADCPGGLACSAGFCRNASCTTNNTDCVCVTASPSPSPTLAPSPSPSPSVPPGTGFYVVKYNDLDGDGHRLDSEPGLSWSFQWDLNGDNSWRDYVTYDTQNGLGGFISTLKGGDKVTIRETGKDLWSSTTPSSVDITLTQGTVQKVEFGNWQKTAPGCNNSCVTSSDCGSGLTCSSGVCRNNACSAKTNCVCDVVGTTPPATTTTTTSTTGTTTAEATPATTPLPASGSTSETVGTIAVGLVITVLGVIGLFAL